MYSLADQLRRADGSAEREALRAEVESLKAKLAEYEDDRAVMLAALRRFNLHTKQNLVVPKDGA